MNQMKENEVANKGDAFPKNFLHLVSQSEIQNATEELIILLHSYLLEVGFVPKDVKDAYSCMPNDWKSSGIFKIQYLHPIVPDLLCWVTWVPLFDNLITQGTVENKELENTVHMTLPRKKYIISEEDISDPLSVFCDIRDLSRLFKDEFCYPLLALLEETTNCKSSFGFSGLIDELKFLIMKELPIEDVVALSSVNSDIHKLANSKYLWRFLYRRDFGSRTVLDSNTDTNWKELYKAEYRKKRSRQRFRSLPMYQPPYIYPQVYPGHPANYMHPPRFQYIDPAIQENFPQLHPRPSNNWLHPGGQYPYLQRYW